MEDEAAINLPIACYSIKKHERKIETIGKLKVTSRNGNIVS